MGMLFQNIVGREYIIDRCPRGTLSDGWASITVWPVMVDLFRRRREATGPEASQQFELGAGK